MWIKGFGEHIAFKTPTYAEDLLHTPIARAADKAFAMSGLNRSDVDIASIYDCYTIMVGITLEDAGVCAKGDFGRLVEERDLSPQGDLPVNTHGGQLGCGQADLAGGMSHIVEAVRQLRGTVGERQVANARLALVTGNGATMSEACALVLGAAA